MKEVDILQKSAEIQGIISKYTKESFVCYFADFIRHHPERGNTGFAQRFKSKLKDSLYLIMLRLSSSAEGKEELFYSPENDEILQKVADILLTIVDFYLDDTIFHSSQKTQAERQNKFIHELAFKDFFQNGTLNYREQELNKVIRLFCPYQSKIKQHLGIDLKVLVDICNYSEKDYRQKSTASKSFIFKKDFAELALKYSKGEIKKGGFLKELGHLSKEFQEDFLEFFERPHSCLLFTKNDYCEVFAKNDVDIFCKLFSVDINDNFDVLFYSQMNPLNNRPIIKINDNEYLNVNQKQLPTALYNLLYTTLTKTSKEKEQLNLRRGKVILETHTQDIFKKFLRKSRSLKIFINYFIDDYTEEKDLLIIVNNIAYVVECKSSRNREPRRDFNQALKRIKSDFDSCIQKGYEQCYQVEQLILKSKKISIRHGKKVEELDTSYIKDIFTIVVTSERFATIQCDLGLLLKKYRTEDVYPWSIYIDDLETFLKTLSLEFNNPIRRFTEFLEYREMLNERLMARDELDVCAMYLRNPVSFKEVCMSKEYVVTDPKLQGYFDQLYFSKKLNFKILDI